MNILPINQYANRAMGAYYKAAEKAGEHASHPRAPELWTSEAGRYYVVLRNVNGVLAVYRVKNDEKLKRLKRWPSDLNDC
jgi:hypothetical protein